MLIIVSLIELLKPAVQCCKTYEYDAVPILMTLQHFSAFIKLIVTCQPIFTIHAIVTC